MDYKKLADMLFPHITKSVSYYEDVVFPARNLSPGAKVTRLAPSPTGFIHLGNLYGLSWMNVWLIRATECLFSA